MKSIFKKLTLLFVLFLSLNSAYAKSKTMYICLEPAVLREKASAVSSKIHELEYGTPVYVIQEKKNWALVCDVEDDSVSGWVPATALSKKKIVAKGSKTSADADEIALAGKGFNSTIEAVYSDEFEIDYSSVDYVESLQTSEASVVKFIKEGQLFLGDSDE